MDVSDASYESELVTSNQIYTLLSDFFDSFKNSRQRFASEDFLKEWDQLFDVLLNTIDSFPKIYFDEIPQIQSTLIEYCLFQFFEFSHGIDDVSLRKKMVLYLKDMLLMSKIRSEDSYQVIIQRIFSFSQRLIANKYCNNLAPTSSFFITETSDSPLNITACIIYVLYKIFCSDKKNLIRYSDKIYKLILYYVNLRNACLITVKLLYLLFEQGLYCSNSMMFKIAQGIQTNSHEAYQAEKNNLIYYSLFSLISHNNQSEPIKYFITGFCEYFFINKNEFLNLGDYEFELIKAIFNNINADNQLVLLKRNLIHSNLPLFYFKKFNIVHDYDFITSTISDKFFSKSYNYDKITSYLDHLNVLEISLQISILKLMILYSGISDYLSESFVLEKIKRFLLIIFQYDLNYFDTFSLFEVILFFGNKRECSFFIEKSILKFPLFLSDFKSISDLLTPEMQTKLTENILDSYITVNDEKLLETILMFSQITISNSICKSLIKINNFKFNLKFLLKFNTLTPREIVLKIFERSIVQLDEECLELFVHFIDNNYIKTNYKNQIDKIVDEILNQDFSNLISFKEQHQYVLVVAKVTYIFVESENFATLFSNIISCAFVLSHTLIPVQSHYISLIFKKLDCSLMDVYHKNPNIFISPFIKCIKFEDFTGLQEQMIKLMTCITLIFNKKENNILISYLISECIKLGVLKCSADMISAIANIKNCCKKELLLNHTKYIIPYILISTQPNELINSIKFIEKEMEVSISLVIKSEFQAIAHHCFLHIHEHPERICCGILSILDRNPFSKIYKYTPGCLSDFFQKRLLGILAFFNFSLASGDTTYKIAVIKGIAGLIETAGQKSTEKFRLKILSLLLFATSISHKYNLSKNIITAWAKFVENLTDKHIGSLMPQIVLSVLLLLPYHEDDVSSVLSKVLLENSIKTHKYLSKLHMFSTKPSLKPVWDRVSNFWKELFDGDIVKILDTFIMAINSDKYEIKKTAIINLSDLFLNKRLSGASILRKQNIAVLHGLYIALLQCCNDARPELVYQAGRCLGVLGSVDYNFFALLENDNQVLQVLKLPKEYKTTVDNFAQKLLACLSNAFLSVSETHYQDCAAFAIQEVLKVYTCTLNDPDNNPHILSFQQTIREVLIPHASSSYSSKSTSHHRVVGKLFGSAAVATFMDWIRIWCSSLILQLDRTTFQGSILYPCYAIVRYHVPTAKFLLPYVIVSLFDCNTCAISILSLEISHILSFRNIHQTIQEDKALALKTIFEIFDFLHKYREFEVNDSIKTKFKQLINEFSKRDLSEAAFSCKLYERALRYLEKYVSSQKNIKQKLDLAYFKKIYYNLNDYDGIIGTSQINDGSIKSFDGIQLEMEGRFMEAISYFEKSNLGDDKMSKIVCQQGIAKNYLNIGQFKSAVSYINNIGESCENRLIPLKMEALWRLSSWGQLDDIIKKYDIQPETAHVINSLVNNDTEQFKSSLVQSYRNIAKNISMTENEIHPLKRCMQSISKLHSLFDIEMFYRISHSLDLFNHSDSINSISDILFSNSKPDNKIKYDEWSKFVSHRLNFTEYSFEIREPLLNIQRVLAGVNKSTVSNFWVSCAKLARKCGYFQTSFNYLLNVDLGESPNLQYLYEMAKFIEKTRSDIEALKFLRKNMPVNPPKTDSDIILYTDLKLMISKFMINTSDCPPFEIFKYYNEIIVHGKNLEKVFFKVGNYFEKLFLSKNGANSQKSESNIAEINIIFHYGSSLKYGYKYLYRSLPRLVTFWLDYAVHFETHYKNSIQGDRTNKKMPANMVADMNKRIEDMCEKVQGFTKTLPPFVFYCVLSQLVSRICHQNKVIWDVLSKIIIQLISTFPHQVIWQMIFIANSAFANRVKRCKIIFDEASKENIEIGSIITDNLTFSSYLLEVCNKKDKNGNVSVTRDFPNLKLFLSQIKSNRLIVPILSCLNCNIPLQLNPRNNQIFEEASLFIAGIHENIDVLLSLMKPKKIVLLGSNGKSYPLLCKPKDDLRRDSRLMEFNALVNKLLDKNPKSRKRNLRIHIYAVVPINDECGILEWVPDTVSYRSIIQKLYVDNIKNLPIDKIKILYTNAHRNNEALLKIFTETILPNYPPVFAKYFYKKHDNAFCWFAARQLFMRSAAVMSMVGYILGLGDRHGENILLSKTGEVVHVDFNCLFNKSDSFEWPEKVPFRLTHNMVHAMGPLGIESCFRTCCEITMEIMRARTESLTGILTTFLHDPLVDWVKARKNVTSVGEQVNELALKMLQDVEKRLRGITSTMSFGVSLSVQGQVHQLIQEATNLSNLSQMYFGWGAYY